MTLSTPSLPPPSGHDEDAFAHAFGRIRAPSSTHDSGSYVPPMSVPASSDTALDEVKQQQQGHATVLRVSREVENIGARVPLSKKRISWRFVVAGSEQVHTVTLEHSRITAKKRLRLDGRRLFNADHYCAGDWTYDFRVGEHAPQFTVAIKDVKATVVDQHSLAGIYELYVDGIAWDALGERVFAGAAKRKSALPVWSSDKFARRVSDETFALAPHKQQPPGTARAWVFAFGVLGTIHRLELWDLDAGAFVVALDSRELARVEHDAIDDETWEYEYTLANQHELVVSVTLAHDGERRYDFAIDGSPWKDMSETDFVLQPGWVPVYSRSKGTAYFRHVGTNETRWEKPIMARSGATLIEQVPSQELQPTESSAIESSLHYDDTDRWNDHHHASPEQPEANLLDFSEIAVHVSPTHAAQQQAALGDRSSAFAAFDPFDPVYQQQAPQYQSKPQTQTQQHTPPVDLLS